VSEVEGAVSEYVSQDPGLVVLPLGLSSSAFKKSEIGTFKRHNERVEGHVRGGRHRNGKILATDPVSFGVFSVILLFDGHTHSLLHLSGREACAVCVSVCLSLSGCVCVSVCVRELVLCRLALCRFVSLVSCKQRATRARAHTQETGRDTHSLARVYARARTNGSILFPVAVPVCMTVDFNVTRCNY